MHTWFGKSVWCGLLIAHGVIGHGAVAAKKNRVPSAATAAVQARARAQATALLAELEQLDQALVATEQRLHAAESQEQALDQQLQTVAADLTTVQKRYQTTERRFRKRLRGLARMRHGTGVLALGDVGSLPDYVATTRMLRWLTTSDKQLHTQYRDDGERLRTLQKTLSEEKITLATTTDLIRQERDQLGKKKDERQKWLNKVSGKKHLRKQAAEERQKAKVELQSMVQKFPSRSGQAKDSAMDQARVGFVAQRGQLPWPAAGKVGTRFGQTVVGQSGTPMVQSGWDIRAPIHNPVRAVAAGRVVYADWLRGYGQVVIIDHQDQYHTLMAHLASMTVRVGSDIGAGHVVGTVGETGSMRGTVLYFEIRHKGVAVDPAGWLRP